LLVLTGAIVMYKGMSKVISCSVLVLSILNNVNLSVVYSLINKQ